ncbi:unnamed protein product [Porites evermanni]|uniref:Uncharacterized protein n=1 Tax=Porites evermanni TaxID=104178 RepID=A0ABN8LU40_9CNID|nr:unnamed protein product [Porites evermanni]
MAENPSTLLRIIVLLITVGCLSAKRFSIMAPNVFHVGVKEQVSITLFDSGNPVNVQLYLQDYPHRRKTFSRIQGRVDQGGNIFLPVKVEAGDLPDTASVDKQYVYLVAKSDDAHYQFHKEAKILLSYRDGMVFIQTDKPIYTPKQRVKFRVIPLEFDMKPSRRKITVVVQNPQGIRVQQWKDLDPSTGIISRILDLQDFALLGNWTITATYGHKDIHNTSVQFEVKEYVLPKFSVKLTVPQYILNSDNLISIGITARYTFGKPVIGTASVYLSIVGRNGTIPFGRHAIMLDRSGVTTFRQRVQVIKQLPGIWFPEKGRLQVKVDVIERATGNKESAEDRSCQFTSSPYLIEYINTPKYFKPGLRYVVKVKVSYPNKQPAGNVPMLISAKGKQGNAMIDLKRFDRDPNVRDNTDENGEAEFVVDACSNCKAITVQVKTDDIRLNDAQNAVANYLAEPFDAANGPLLMVRQLSRGKVGRKIHCESYRNLNNVAAKLSFAVVSRGRILSHNTTDLFDGIFKSWSFRVTPQMSPSARLIGYYIDSNEKVVADSILLKVEDSLPTEVNFPDAFVQVRGSRVQLNRIDKRPSEKYILKIEASEGTRLGLLSVDESVYLLRNDNRLTKEKIFKAAEELDLGCGVGGGKDSRDIFKKAGVVLMTNDFVSDGREDYGCAEDMSRKKRDVRGKLEDTICCDMAKDNGNVSCGKLSVDSNKGLSTRCRMSFWNCCMALYGAKDTALLGRSGLDAGNFEDYSDEKILDQTQKRSFFPETWIFDEKVVGSDGRFEMGFTMPDTITTWVMQAVAINNKTGLGLATPLNIVVFKEFFVSVKMPYSVKKGEQISLLATVYNYHNEEIRAKLYLRGDQDFCSIAQNRELSSIGNVRVPPRDARSVAVPIVPKRVGETEIEVSLIVQIKHGGSFRNAAGDIVIKKLLVVPEGKETQKSQTFILDPNGYLSDRPRSEDSKPDKPIKFPFESTRQYRPNDQLQVDNIKLSVPKAIIPGSVSAKIYLTGNLLGPIVNTTIQGGLESFIRMPGGCGEQTMRSFSPNVYVFEYLMTTNQVTGTMEADAHRFIQAGYQRVLTFRRADTSFSIWGEDRPGSVWLTAFVMKTFCKAQKFSGVNIDENLVCSSVRWLIQNQGGAGFPALVYGRHLAGGVSGEGDVAMTAFVLAALGECKCPGVNSQTAINNAKAYLEVQYKTLNKPYSMALTAYALSLVNSVERFKANDRLVQNAVYDNVKKSRYWNAGGEALDIETAGYALMAQIILGRTGYAGPIVTYLTNKRRGGVGFSSSQDTFVALQALALYSERTAGNTLDLRVKLTSEIDAAWKPPEIHITPQKCPFKKTS